MFVVKGIGNVFINLLGVSETLEQAQKIASDSVHEAVQASSSGIDQVDQGARRRIQQVHKDVSREMDHGNQIIRDRMQHAGQIVQEVNKDASVLAQRVDAIVSYIPFISREPLHFAYEPQEVHPNGLVRVTFRGRFPRAGEVGYEPEFILPGAQVNRSAVQNGELVFSIRFPAIIPEKGVTGTLTIPWGRKFFWCGPMQYKFFSSTFWSTPHVQIPSTPEPGQLSLPVVEVSEPHVPTPPPPETAFSNEESFRTQPAAGCYLLVVCQNEDCAQVGQKVWVNLGLGNFQLNKECMNAVCPTCHQCLEDEREEGDAEVVEAVAIQGTHYQWEGQKVERRERVNQERRATEKRQDIFRNLSEWDYLNIHSIE